MLMKSEVTEAPQTPQRPVHFFLLCGNRSYTASKVHCCSEESHNPQLVTFSLVSLRILIIEPAEQVSALGYLCPASPASPLGLWYEKGMCFLEAKNGRARGVGEGRL